MQKQSTLQGKTWTLAVRGIYSSIHYCATDSYLPFPLGLLSVTKISGKELSVHMWVWYVLISKCVLQGYCNSDNGGSSQA